MKNNIIKTILGLFLIGIVSIPVFAFADELTVDAGSIGGANTSDTSFGSFIPNTGGENTGGADISGFISLTPNSTGENIGGADTNTAGTFVPVSVGGNIGGADTNTAGIFVPVSTGGNTGGADTGIPATIPTTPPASTGSTGGSTGSSSGGSRSGGSRIVALPTLISLNSCIYINDYLKFGANNNSAEVTKLQTFLKNTQEIDVDINGVFDNKTLEAVKVFQSKYSSDILSPWGGNVPTGHVYFTTKKKINEVYCKSNFSLTSEQLAQIEAYKKDRANGIVPAEGNTTPTTSTTPTNTINTETTLPLTPEIGANDNSDQTAAVSTATSTNVVKKFFKWLFGY